MLWLRHQFFILMLRFTLSLQYRALHERFRDHYEAEKKKTDEKSVPFERVTQLYSKSSRAHVQIIGRRVDALGEDGSPYGEICFRFVAYLFCNLSFIVSFITHVIVTNFNDDLYGLFPSKSHNNS